MIRWKNTIVTMCALIFMGSTLSVNADPQVNVKIKGKLIVNPPCELTAEDGSDTITVDFNDILIRKMETKLISYSSTSGSYQKQLPYKLTCDAATGTAVRIQLTGAPADFNSELLSTDNKDVGIQFINLNKGTFIPNNTGRRAQVIIGTSSLFYVIPIRNSNTNVTNIKTGGFSATATLTAEYE